MPGLFTSDQSVPGLVANRHIRYSNLIASNFVYENPGEEPVRLCPIKKLAHQ
jgi:hypothetical protein